MYVMPRPINTATRPGQLRNLLNIGIEEFAEVVGLSTHMIRSIESGREPLSRQAAEGISFGAGVDTEWLLGQGRSNLPTTLDLDSGEHVPYTREHYRQRSTPRNPGEPLNPFLNDVCLVRCRRLMAFLRAAERKGKAPAALYLFKRFIEDGVEKLESFPDEQKRMHRMIEQEFTREGELVAERERKQRWMENRALTGPRDEPPPGQQRGKKRA